MALTPSTMLPLGTLMPDFSLPDVSTGVMFSSEALKDKKAVLVMFICAHCPYVIHVQEELARLGRDYLDVGVGIVAISSNDAAQYPEDGPDGLKAMAHRLGLEFPLLFDASQDVAHAFQAACTPDFFLFNHALKLVYRGQLDGSRPGKGNADGRDLRAALDAVLAGREVTEKQMPSVGCNIKWR